MRKLSFIQNTVVLVASNLITGALGFLFSIILSREIGAHGVGLYSMVMPVYSLFICLSCGGTTTALSKIVAEKGSCGNQRELYKTVAVSIAFFSFWTACVSIFAALFTDYISSSLLKDPRTYLPILAFIPALVFLSIGSILKGYFYGMQNSTFPAVIDIIEKGIRIIVLVTLVAKLKDYGLKYQVAGAVLAMTAGELSSTALLYGFYRRSRKSTEIYGGRPDNSPQIIVNVLSISLPLCLNGLLATASGAFIAAMVPRRLEAAGFARETALALFGKVAGMGFNIIMFPAIIIGAISIILVPVISQASAERSASKINSKISSTINMTSAIAAASAAMFFTLPGELGQIFYQRADLEKIIYFLSFGVLFSYLESTLFGILNGLGRQKILLRNTIIMSAIDIAVLYIFLGVPEINIYGYAINFVISPLAGCILNYAEIYRITGVQISISDAFAFPVAIAAADILLIKALKPLVYGMVQNRIAPGLLLLVIGFSAYALLYISFKRGFKKNTG